MKTVVVQLYEPTPQPPSKKWRLAFLVNLFLLGVEIGFVLTSTECDNEPEPAPAIRAVWD